ncbi:MAG TPA: Nif3-like dinuclear metal center hexameric protein [Clostridiaceae bacterium]|nr:Nif3-like dinuclear metal center hexameric protein [Clostridiaceae bacterium]
MKIKSFIQYMNRIAPPEYAEVWDHCGLQFGRQEAEVVGIVLALDLVPQAVDFAIVKGCNLIVTHHPAIFQPLQTITDDDPETELILRCIEHDIAVFSAHTNLDNAVGGVNDVLMTVLGYRPSWTPVPLDLGDAEAKIFEGELTAGLGKTVRPGGMRAVELAEPVGRKTLTWKLNQTLLTSGCLINFDEDQPVERLAVSGGSFPGEWIRFLVEQQIDFLVAGEIKYHDMLTLAAHDIGCAACGHDTSERIVMSALAEQFRSDAIAPKIEVYQGLNYNNIVF